MATVQPLPENTIKYENYDSDRQPSYVKKSYNSVFSEPEFSERKNERHYIKNEYAQENSEFFSKSADDILDKPKKDRSKRPQTISYVKQEAEQVFNLFCTKMPSKSSSAPTSFSARIDRSIDEDKMKKLKEIIRRTSDSEHEDDKHKSEFKNRKKKSFFIRIKERIQALNKKEALNVRSEKGRQKQNNKRTHEDKNNFTQKIFDTFRARRNYKKSKGTTSYLDSSSEKLPPTSSSQSTFPQASHPTPPRAPHHTISQGSPRLPRHTIPQASSSSILPLSPQVFFPKSVEIIAEESRKSGASVYTTAWGSSVDIKQGSFMMGKFDDLKYIDEDDEMGVEIPHNENTPTTSDADKRLIDNNDRGYERYSGRNNDKEGDITYATSAVDRDHRLSSISDSGCEDVLDKYTQVANLLDEISKEVNDELKGSISDSNSSWLLAVNLASKSSYQYFHDQLNEFMSQRNEPLVKQVALLFSVARSAITIAGISTDNARSIRDNLLHYYDRYFAPQVAKEGGLESLTDSET